MPPELPPGWHWPPHPPEHYDSLGTEKTGTDTDDSILGMWLAADGTPMDEHRYAATLRAVLHHLERH